VQITIILPTYNEAENIENIIKALFALPLPELKAIIVDDNSPDHTGEIADRLAKEFPGRLKVIHQSGKFGLGTAYIVGFKQALTDGAEAIGEMDSDFSHPIDRLVPMAEALKHSDIALGSRYISGGSLDDAWPVWRKALSGFANLYARTILGIPIRDVTGGFRLFSRESLQAVPLERIKSNGYVFQVEIAYVTYLLGYKSAEIPIHFSERRAGKSKMSFRIQMEAAFRVWQLKGMYPDLKNKILLK
jgi:dolichol-phosphate mannosyltransferase